MVMDLHATDALVTGYEDLIDGLQLTIRMIVFTRVRRLYSDRGQAD
jgi:hypothetical protein